VHTADIHLDSPLQSLALQDEELFNVVGTATRLAFVSLINLCLREKVDALLIAGDLYDGGQTSMSTAIFLAQQLRRLTDAGIEVYIVRGNHDAASIITRELKLDGRAKIFEATGSVVMAKCQTSQIPVAIHGVSFDNPHETENLVELFGEPVPGAINIGILHTNLSGRPGHDPYAPCKEEDLHTTGFDYWALGHIHKGFQIEGKSRIVIPGNLQGRDINESGPKSVALVTINDDRTIQVETRHTSIAQFEKVGVNLTGVSVWDEISERIGETLRAVKSGIVGEYLVARVKLTGTTVIAWNIRRDPERLLAEARNEAAGIGNCYVEKIESDCELPVEGKASDNADPLLELRKLIGADVLTSDFFKMEFDKIENELKSHLPSECKKYFGTRAC
jgi:DNA repair exonuclease SbcCD nuclease subunit